MGLRCDQVFHGSPLGPGLVRVSVGTRLPVGIKHSSVWAALKAVCLKPRRRTLRDL